ncbi:MAG: M28 family peptidase, partial [Promethearchaeota archaeon]
TMLRNYLVNLVSFGSRVTGTYSCEKAAEYLYLQFEKMGLESKYHNWSVHNNKKIPMLFKDKNIIATQRGSNDSYEGDLIFNAHFDAVKNSPGANDDGSGTIAVLAAAYVLSQFEFNRTIKYILFSGEEQGLLGSHEYAKALYENNEKILVEMNADMIGHTRTAEGGRKYRVYATNDVIWIMDVMEIINQDYNINFELLKGITTLEGGGGSDYINFVRYGYDTLAFFQAEMIVKYWHTPLDLIENVNFSYLVNTTRLIVGTLAHLADFKDTARPQIKIASPKRGYLYYEDRIIHDFEKFETKIIDDFVIYAEVEGGNSPISHVEFYYDDKLSFTDTEAPFHWRLNKLSLSEHMIKVVAYDESGKTAHDEMNIFYLNLNKRK